MIHPRDSDDGATTTVVTDGPDSRRPGGSLRQLIAAHPIAALAIVAFALGWPLLTIRSTTDFAPRAVGYAFTYVALFGSALVVSWAGGGGQGVTRLLSRYLIWRVGLRRWALIVLALPALTVAVAAVSGTVHVAGHGWAYVVGVPITVELPR
ncbi:MAG: hypothetical protein QOK30_135 [Nocardioidaceae bacterium]|nr:hypothetical protein [Nocardioidaceae bacterium]